MLQIAVVGLGDVRIAAVIPRAAGSGKPQVALRLEKQGQPNTLGRAVHIRSHQRALSPSFPLSVSRLIFVSSQPSTIAPLQTIRRFLHRDSHVSPSAASARVPDANKKDVETPGVADEEFVPPSRPPPGQNTITAADGTVYGEDQLRHLIGEVKDYQITHGSLLKVVKHETDSSVPTRGVGVSLLPTPFPRSCFQQALDLQEAFQELYVRVSSDPAWLYSVLEPLVEHDTFIAALWNVYVRVRDANSLQSVVCGIFRSDYMLHQPPESEVPVVKQVEFNPFSAAGACHAERVSNMHRRLGRMRGLTPDIIANHLPENHNTRSIVTLLKAAHQTYISTLSADSSRPKCVLMTVQPFNFNIADERPIQHGLWDAEIPCYRCEWQAALHMITVTDDRTLLYRPAIGDTEYEVSVIYYRGGYEAAEYREQSRETRFTLEMSRAIKCPDILMHLTTCKSVQEALSRPGVLERFLPPEKGVLVRSTFMHMQSLDDTPSGKEAQLLALNPATAIDYVLKPNRDGGGHNIYRADIPQFLSTKSHQSWKNYVLMRLIQPPPTTGTLMMPHELYHGAAVSELGVVGTCLWRRSEGAEVQVVLNDVAGWTFKTKSADVDEMSVVKGYGCFDCPWLS